MHCPPHNEKTRFLVSPTLHVFTSFNVLVDASTQAVLQGLYALGWQSIISYGFNRRELRSEKSAITKHLDDTQHTVDPQNAFSILYRAKSKRPFGFAKAIAIQRLTSNLCIQKEMLVGPNLSWRWICSTIIYKFCYHFFSFFSYIYIYISLYISLIIY